MTDTFKVSLSTPIGKKEGTIKFENDNGVLSGALYTMGSVSYFRNGTMIGNTFEFSGVLRATLFRFKYHAKGTIEGDKLIATAATSSGTFQINGARITSR